MEIYDLPSMITAVKYILSLKKEQIKSQYWLNNNHNYIIVTERRQYLLKWNKELFGAAGYLIKKLPPGPGLTVNRFTVEEFIQADRKSISPSYILFAWIKSYNKIYYMTTAAFDQLSEPYQQKSGEWERVVSVRNVVHWTVEEE